MVTHALSGTRFSLLPRRRGQHRSEFRSRRRRLAMRLESLEPRLMLANDLLLADFVTDSLLRFEAETGAPLGAFVSSGSGGLVDPLDPTFAPDGDLYVISNDPAGAQVLRYDGENGTFIDVFVDTGSGGFNGASAIEFGPDGDLFVATNSAAGVLRYEAGTGAFKGSAASASFTRASGLQFGPDGNLYVFDADTDANAADERILRFEADTGDLIDEFVSPGVIQNAFDFTFGPDNHIYVDDATPQAILRFSGATGEPLGVFNAFSNLIESPIFDSDFGSDGNVYAATAERVVRFDVETGQLLDVFVEGNGGTITFFPSTGADADLIVTNVATSATAFIDEGVSIDYTVTNNSANPTASSAWVDVVYWSEDETLDPFDTEIGRIPHSGVLAGGGSYSETLTVPSPEIVPGAYYTIVITDRRGESTDLNRLNNIAATATTTFVLPRAEAVDPAHTIAVGRTLSDWTTASLVGNELTITYTVYNVTADFVADVSLETMLQSGVILNSASIEPVEDGGRLVWDAGLLGPLETFSVDVVVTLDTSTPLILDSGASAAGTVNFVESVADAANPAVLRTDAINSSLLAATPDANSNDLFVRAKAAELNQDVDQIFNFMTQSVGYESYSGSLRGSRGTLWSSAGNALDQASLMVAMLRASGVPASYVSGALPTEAAQELILSMFPEPLRVTGLIPDGAITGDPANDPGLLAETQNHFWVRFDAGAGLMDTDPSFADAMVGDTFAASDGTFFEVPDSLRHKTTVQLDRELINTASSLFLGGATPDVATVLDETFNTVELVGKPLTIGHFVDQRTVGTPIFTSITNTYGPYLAIGDYGLPVDDDVYIRGTDYQEVITNFPLGTSVLTGLFLRIALSGPDGPDEIFQRTLVDLIGFDARTNGGSPNLTFDPGGSPTLTPLDVFTVNVLPSEFDTRAGRRLAHEVTAQQSHIAEVVGHPLALGGEDAVALQELYISQTRLTAAEVFQLSDLFTSQAAEAGIVRAYFDRPRITITANQMVADEDGASSVITSAIDLRRDTIRVVVPPGQNVTAARSFRITRGIVENVVETSLASIQVANVSEQTTPVVSTVRVFEEAAAAGIGLTVITQENLGLLDALPYSAEAEARISEAAAFGKSVLVPERPVLIGDREAIAWYEIDRETGETIGVTEDGGHQAITEYAAQLFTASVLVGSFIGAATYIRDLNNCIGGGKTLKQCKDQMGKDLTDLWKNLEGYAKGQAGSAATGSSAAAVALGPLGAIAGAVASLAGLLTQGASIAAAMVLFDPPLPDQLLAPPRSEEFDDLSGIGVATKIVSDPLYTLPFAGVQLESVFRIGIRNGQGIDDRFSVHVTSPPSGFDLLTSVPEIAVPTSAVGEVGLVLRPTDTLPPAGTDVSLSVEVTSVSDPFVKTTETVTITVPETPGVAFDFDSSPGATIPGSPIEIGLSLKGVGNVPTDVKFNVILPDGLTLTGLSPVVVDPGETIVLPLTLTPDVGTPLNSSLTAMIEVDFGAAETQVILVAIRVAAPGAGAAANASSIAARLGNSELAGRLADLTVALTNVVHMPINAVFKDQSLAAVDAVEQLLNADVAALAAISGPLSQVRGKLAAASLPTEIQDAVNELSNVIENLAATLEAVLRSKFELFLLPNSIVTQPSVPQDVELTIQNVGTETTAYNVSIAGLPASVNGVLSDSQVTLDRGEVAVVTATFTQTSTTDLAPFDFTIDVTTESTVPLTKSATGSFTSRREFVSVTSVDIEPAFTDPGGQVVVSARVLNAVNRVQQARASFVVRDSAGAQIGTVSAPVDVTLGVQTSLVDVSLGTFDTTGLIDGNYTVVVTLVDENGAPIPGGSGSTTLLVGSPLSASIDASPSVLPPGTSTVTNSLEIAAVGSFEPVMEPLTLVGHVPVSGDLRGVAARGDVAYASSTTGIQIIDYSDPANPVITGTIPGNHRGARIQDNVLLALRPSGTAVILDVFALQDTPLAPPLIGSSDLIRYDLQTDLQSNSTHAFVTQFQVCVFLGSNDAYFHGGDLISIALNLDDIANPTSASPAVENVLFNTHGDNVPISSDVSGCPQNGGENNVWSVELVDASTAYLATTSVTGGNTQAGVGRVRIVDISDTSSPSVVRDLDIPGTVEAMGIGVSGNTGVVIGSTGGFADNPFGLLTGNLTVTTLDVSDPLDPQIITTRTLDRISSTFWANFVDLGNGLFSFSNLGLEAGENNPAVIVIDASNPRSPLIGQSAIPLELIALNSLNTDGDFLFTADADGVSIYTINPLPGLPVTARVQIPNGTGVSVVTDSFSIPPTEVIAESTFDSYVFDLTLSPSLLGETLTWQSTVTNLQPGESRPVTHGTTIDFAFQGSAGQVTLPHTSVVAEQVLSLVPGERSVRPGEAAPFSIAIANPSMVDVTYDLSVSGVPGAWVAFDESTVTVPAGGSTVAFLRLTSGPFDVLGDYGFVVNAMVDGVTTSVSGTLILEGAAILPDPKPESQGVVVSLTPTSATAGQGTAATYVARVFNVGSQSDDFVLFVSGLPSEFQSTFAAGIFNVAPGASNFRDVLLTIVPPEGVTADDYAFSVTAASTTDVSITGVTAGALTVLDIGVAVDVTPESGAPNSTFQMLVTNTGQVTETYDLSVAAPAALVATLGTTIVTLDPGASQTVPIDIGAIDFAFPGSLPLVGVATSRTNAAVRAADSVDVSIDETLGFSAAFDRPARVLPQPGPATLLLQVDNVGNLEDQYSATIMSTNGPITASLQGLDGQPAQSVPLFILPGLSTGALLVNTMLTEFGVGEVTVQIRSLSDDTIVHQAIATVMAEEPIPTTLAIAALNADRAEGDEGNTPFTFTVTRSGNVSGPTTVDFNVSGSGANAADAADFGGGFPSRQVMFAANQTSQTLTVNVSGDTMVEPDEGFTVTLFGATDGATIESDMAVGVIRNDDGKHSTCHHPLKPLWWQIACQLWCHHAEESGEHGHSHHWPHFWTHDWPHDWTQHDGTIHGLLEWAAEPGWLACWLGVPWSLWQALDVDRDGSVAPLDALHVINHLNHQNRLRATASPSLDADTQRYDIDKDGLVSAYDVLMVVNHLNRMQRLGQSLSTPTVPPVPPIPPITPAHERDRWDDDLLQLLADDLSRILGR